VRNSIVLDSKVVAMAKDTRRRQPERRFIAAVVIVAAVVGAWLVWHFSSSGGGGSGTTHSASITALSLPRTGAMRARSITDGVLRVPVPHGGTGSINPGFQKGRPVAWILVGDFRFPADWGARHLEGAPTVPNDGILVVVGDFILGAYSSDWPSVQRLHLPSSPRASQFSWNVRFAGRALRVSVQFGSVPDQGRRARANALLAGIRRL
jgi:hypothetical protein